MSRRRNTQHAARANIRSMMNEIRALEREIGKAMVEAFPLHSNVSWEHGDHIRHACVVEHYPRSARMRVRGVTGAAYVIDVEKVMR